MWARVDDAAEYAAARTGLAELALAGCSTVFDHHYVFPRGGAVSSRPRSARRGARRAHRRRTRLDGSGRVARGFPPDSLVEDVDAVLADTERLAGLQDAEGFVRIAVAPCSPFSVTTRLMEDSAGLARRLGLHPTHLAETIEEDEYCSELYGCRPVEYLAERGWLANAASGAPTASI